MSAEDKWEDEDVTNVSFSGRFNKPLDIQWEPQHGRVEDLSPEEKEALGIQSHEVEAHEPVGEKRPPVTEQPKVAHLRTRGTPTQRKNDALDTAIAQARHAYEMLESSFDEYSIFDAVKAKRERDKVLDVLGPYLDDLERRSRGAKA